MDTAQTLYEKFIGSSDAKAIIESALEIKKHFSDVLKMEPINETGEELLYLVGGKKGTLEWHFLLLILYINMEGYENYFKALIKKEIRVSKKQYAWINKILAEIQPTMNEEYIKYYNDLLTVLEQAKEDENLKKEPELTDENSNNMQSNYYLAGVVIVVESLLQDLKEELVEKVLNTQCSRSGGVILKNAMDDNTKVTVLFDDQLAHFNKSEADFFCHEYSQTVWHLKLNPKDEWCQHSLEELGWFEEIWKTQVNIEKKGITNNKLIIGLLSKLFGAKKPVVESLKLQEIFCNLVGININTLGVKQPINIKSINLVRNYQTMRRPGTSFKNNDILSFPQYKISKGKIFRGGILHEDMKLGMIIPRMKQYSVDNLIQEIYLIIQRLAKFPVINFCMSLPYLAAKNPTKEGLFCLETLVDIYKGIDNMLFEIYEELNEGHFLTGFLVLQKVSKILDVTLQLPSNQLEEINKCFKYDYMSK